MTIQERVKKGEVLSAVAINGYCSFYMAQSSWFVMNYEKYYPSEMEIRDRRGRYDGPLFRQGIREIDAGNSDIYLNKMDGNKVLLSDIKQYLASNPDSLSIIFLIDFDSKRYVSWFFDIDYEEYIPSDWEGVFASPLDFLPDEVRQIWQK